MTKYMVSNTEVNLTAKDYLTQGGEGKIYVKGGVVYKICDSESGVIPADKISELSVLNRPNIIRPESLILKNGRAVGYTMSYINNTYSLCQLFTKVFKDRNGIGPDKIIQLMRVFRDTVEFIHARNILIVDLNELNFLVGDKFDNIYFIDVNSYQTPSYPATAIMDSIRDRHNTKFSMGTDWFSFGIVTFQLFMSIHPYKGKHNGLTTLDERMRKNVSVFNPTVRVPGICPSFDIIPTSLKNWYVELFERGKRLPPPSDFTAQPILVVTRAVVSGNKLRKVAIETFGENAREIVYVGGEHAVTLEGGTVQFGGRTYGPIPIPFAFTVFNHRPVVLYIKDGQLESDNFENTYKLGVFVKRIFQHDGRIYAQTGELISEVTFLEMKNGRSYYTLSSVGIIHEQSAQFFDGVIFQGALKSDGTNSYFISIFPESKQCRQLFLPELAPYKIVEAKYQGQILVVVGVRSGKYDRFIFKIGPDFQKYEVSSVSDIPLTAPNFAVLKKGVCVLVNEDEQLAIFSTKLGETDIKIIDDPLIKTGVQLRTDGDKIIGMLDREIFQITM